jgi:hypothetical protein
MRDMAKTHRTSNSSPLHDAALKKMTHRYYRVRVAIDESESEFDRDLLALSEKAWEQCQERWGLVKFEPESRLRTPQGMLEKWAAGAKIC